MLLLTLDNENNWTLTSLHAETIIQIIEIIIVQIQLLLKFLYSFLSKNVLTTVVTTENNSPLTNPNIHSSIYCTMQAENCVYSNLEFILTRHFSSIATYSPYHQEVRVTLFHINTKV